MSDPYLSGILDTEPLNPQEEALRVDSRDSRILVSLKRHLSQRLGPRTWEEQPKPMPATRSSHYETAERTRANPCGGVSAFHVLAQRVGPVKALDRELHLLREGVSGKEGVGEESLLPERDSSPSQPIRRATSSAAPRGRRRS